MCVITATDPFSDDVSPPERKAHDFQPNLHDGLWMMRRIELALVLLDRRSSRSLLLRAQESLLADCFITFVAKNVMKEPHAPRLVGGLQKKG